MGKLEKALWPKQIMSAALFAGLIAATEFLARLFFLRYVDFWPLTLLRFLSGVFFGGWGIVAVSIETILFPSDYGCFPPSYPELYGLAHVIFQVLLPAWAFRYFKADPRLETERDVALFFGFAYLAALLSILPLILGQPPTGWPFNIVLLVNLAPWFFFTTIFILVSFPLIRFVAKHVIKTKAYCRGWFS